MGYRAPIELTKRRPSQTEAEARRAAVLAAMEARNRIEATAVDGNRIRDLKTRHRA